MAFQSKSEARLALAQNYNGNVGTLQSSSVKGPKDMGDNGPRRLMGKMSGGGRNTDGLKGGKLYGKTGKAASSSGLGGAMSGGGYPSPPHQNMAPDGGKTTRMNPDEGKVSAKMMIRSSTPKPLRGGANDD